MGVLKGQKESCAAAVELELQESGLGYKEGLPVLFHM